MPEWYEKYGKKYCLKCQTELSSNQKSNFCPDHASDIMMGVGGCFYPTSEHFIKEAELRGVSKRLGKCLPEDIESVISRCFLVHNTTKQIFGFFFIRFEIIIKKDINISEELKRRGVTPIVFDVAIEEGERGCGHRKHGGLYATCYVLPKEEFEKIMKNPEFKDMIDNVELHGPLITFKHPIPAKDFKYSLRGFVYVNGDNILLNKPTSQWKWKAIVKKSVTNDLTPVDKFL